MSLAPLDSCIPKYISLKTIVKIKRGPIFKLTGNSNDYWDNFFKKHPDNSIVSIKDLLKYPNFNSPEWLVMYKNNRKLSFNKTDDSILILVGCSFGLMRIGEELHRPDYVYLEVQSLQE